MTCARAIRRPAKSKSARGSAIARTHVDDRKIRDAPVTHLVAVYMTAFALALAFLVYVALTRLIVKPVEALARATDRVASGARKLETPASGARELSELSQSVSAMTARLIADEESLRKKVGELEDAQCADRPERAHGERRPPRRGDGARDRKSDHRHHGHAGADARGRRDPRGERGLREAHAQGDRARPRHLARSARLRAPRDGRDDGRRGPGARRRRDERRRRALEAAEGGRARSPSRSTEATRSSRSRRSGSRRCS